MVCLGLYPVKMVSWKKHLIHLITQAHMCFSWRYNCLTLVCSRSALCIPLFSLQVTKMKVKGQDLIAFRICTASSRAFFLFKHLLNIRLIQNLKYVRYRQWYNGYAVLSKECNGFLLVSLLDPIPLFISNPLLFFVLSTIILLCNHHHCPSLEHFSSSETETVPLKK